MRHILDRGVPGLNLDEYGLHFVALAVGDEPCDFVPLRLLFEKVVGSEHDLFLLVLGEKLRRGRAEGGKHIEKRLNRRGSQLVFELGDIAFSQFATVRKLLLSKPALQTEAFYFCAEFHKPSLFSKNLL